MMAELKTRVEELKMENEYQLRLKDMNYNEKNQRTHGEVHTGDGIFEN